MRILKRLDGLEEKLTAVNSSREDLSGAESTISDLGGVRTAQGEAGRQGEGCSSEKT